MSLKPVHLEVGSNQPIHIEKLFGPLIFADIRVTAESKTCEWVVERLHIDSQEWIEVARIPGQLDEEFDNA